MNSHSLSIDLILQILSRLPAKSVVRFRCLSKQWASILGSPYFTELFLTMSSAKPHLLFAIEEEEEDGLWSFFSLPQLQNPCEKSSSTLVLAADFQVKLSRGDLWIYPDSDIGMFTCAYASGLIFFHGNRYVGRSLVCNPDTGLYATLPYLFCYRRSHSFFGFDPIEKQYKVLSMHYPCDPGLQKILTLGRDMSWRKIKCSLRHDIKSEGVCINGVLYYLGDTSEWPHVNHAHDVTSDYVIVCFDLRSEKFTFIDVERFCRLINYKGKLAVIFWDDDVDNYSEDDFDIYSEDDVDIHSEDDVDADATIELLHVWVQEDVEKQEWSKYAYTLSDDKFFDPCQVSVAGVTPWGEIVFAMNEYTSKKPFYIFYFNPEKNTLLHVEIKGFGKTSKKLRSVWTFVNHIEDLNVNDLKLVSSPFVSPEYFESDSESD